GLCMANRGRSFGNTVTGLSRKFVRSPTCFTSGSGGNMNYRKLFLLFALCLLAAVSPLANAQYQMQVYGLWHCYDDACSWASVPNMTTFDTNNHWIIDRGNGYPSVNVVVLSFVNPVKLMNLTSDSTTTNGIPIGMNQLVINYFQSKGIRVMMSIGGFSYTKLWDKAL